MGAGSLWLMSFQESFTHFDYMLEPNREIWKISKNIVKIWLLKIPKKKLLAQLYVKNSLAKFNRKTLLSD